MTSSEERPEPLEDMFQRLREAKLKLGAIKYTLDSYLGHSVSYTLEGHQGDSYTAECEGSVIVLGASPLL